LKKYEQSFIDYLDGRYDLLSEEQKQVYLSDKPEINNQKITLRNLCEGLGVAVPEKYESIADEPQRVAFRDKDVKKGDICLILRSAEEFDSRLMTTEREYNRAIEYGAKMIIMGADDFHKAGLDEEKFPVILMDNSNERVLRLFSILREQQKAKVVMLTGSIGKTTTKEMCMAITKNRFKMFSNPSNSNTVQKTANFAFYNSNDKNEVYIQECGAGNKGSVRLAASILQPDIFILTNVHEHHLQAYHTFENLFDDKTSADDYLKENGVVITNYDDEGIRNHTFKHKVISFAVDYEDADYRALNISQFRDELTFDILETKTGHLINIKVKLLGKHNVYNIMAAYIMGRQLGLTEEQIKEDLLEYHTTGIRQNLMNIGGVYINVDCYNVAEESIIAMLKGGESFELDPGSKRIALIGGENKLGSEVIPRSKEAGKKLAGIKMDKVLFCGIKNRTEPYLNHYGDAVSMKEGYDAVSDVSSKMGTRIKHMVKFLNKNVKRGDLVMFKGIYHLDMPIAIDKYFGTSISYELGHYKKTIQKFKTADYVANMIPKFNEMEIVDIPVKSGKLTIPKKIEGNPVFRIRKRAFRYNEEIKLIDFGKSVKNIGERAFWGCTNLEKLNIPSNVRVIEEKAFGNCSNLTYVCVSDGTTHISTRAFVKCKNLKEIHLPPSVGMIEENAFKGCKNAVIYCQEGTYAHEYAKQHNLEFELEKNKRLFGRVK